ncbi:MAG: serine/threonine protein kinase [Myxococcales bacterium]|nr:serine/threonine protein kinase [Myxococcales bacterium]
MRDEASPSPASAQATGATVAEASVLERHMQGLIGRLRQRASVPRTLGRYRVHRVLGRGGMGTVYAAHDEELDRPVALKQLHASTSEAQARRLVREAQALAKLSHPNVVQVYEVTRDQGRWLIAMELVEGQTLRAWQATRPGWRRGVEVLLQAGQGLAAAHAAGLVHRDFKPDNCIIDPTGRVRVLDFGLVRDDEETAAPKDDASVVPSAARGAPEATRTGTVLGTPAYMPLEQLTGGRADARSDQFAFCVSLFEAIHGVRPFRGTSRDEMWLERAAERFQPAPADVRVPRRLLRALRRGLAADPEDRWPSMEALLEELRRLVAPRRGRWVAASLVMGVVAAAAMAAGRPREDGCAEGRGALAWGDRDRVRAALSSAGSIGEDTWIRVEPMLDEHAAAWTRAHEQACAFTDGGGASDGVLRLVCLEHQRVELEAVVRVLADADAPVVPRAVDLVDRLPRADECRDDEALRARVAPPVHEAAAVEQARAALIESSVARRAGRAEAARIHLHRARRALAGVGHGPILARLAREEGELLAATGEHATAEAALREAMAHASRARDWDELRRSTQALVLVLGERARSDEALRYRELLMGLAAADPRAEARAHDALARILEAAGQLDQAEAALRRALAIREHALGPEHLAVARTLAALATIHEAEGHRSEAALLRRRAATVGAVALGPEHPFVLALRASP